VNFTEYNKWRERADLVKSTIISQSSKIEDLMSYQLAIRFSNEPKEVKKFVRIFFETTQTSFHGIIELYKQYLTEFEPEWLKDNPDFFAKLGKLKTIRNEFAHAINPLDKDLENIENINKISVIIIKSRKGENQIIKYSSEEMLKITDDLESIIKFLKLLLIKIAKQKGVGEQDILKIMKS